MVPDIKPTPMSLPPVLFKRLESLSQFLVKTSFVPGDTQAELKPNEPVDEKLKDLSKKTGLSVQTLTQIKKVESKINDHKRLQNKTLAVIEDRQEH